MNSRNRLIRIEETPNSEPSEDTGSAARGFAWPTILPVPNMALGEPEVPSDLIAPG